LQVHYLAVENKMPLVFSALKLTKFEVIW